MDAGTMLVILSKSGGQFDGHDKSAIYSHIARTGHKKRRQRQSAATQQRWVRPAELPHGSPSQLDQILEYSAQCDIHNLTRVQNCTRCQRSENLLACLTWQKLIPHKGNSDPFDAQRIIIDARTSQYIEVGFNLIDTKTWSNGFRVAGLPRGYAAQKAMVQDSDPNLYLYGTQLASSANTTHAWSAAHGYAVLANIAATIYSRNSTNADAQSSLEYSTRCMSVLRHSLAQDPKRCTSRPEELILRLLKAEVMANHLDSADVHARFLQHHIMQQASAGAVDCGLLARVLFQTNHLAIATGRIPQFDAHFIAEVFKPAWLPLTSRVLDDRVMEDALGGYIANENLCALMTALKRLWLESASFVAGSSVPSWDNWYWLISREQWLQLSLLNFIRDQEAEVLSKSGSSTKSDLQMSLVLANAALSALRFTCIDQTDFCGEPLFPYAYMILSRLSAHFSEFQTRVEKKTTKQHDPALLWVAFVAALVEHRNQAALMREGRIGLWKQQLINMIVNQQICAWEDLRQRFALFPYLETELPIPFAGWLDGAFHMAYNAQLAIDHASFEEWPAR